MLCDVQRVMAIPGMNNQAAVPLAFLNDLIGAADRAVKEFCKRELELQSFVEFYDGTNLPDVIAKQFPVLSGATQIAAGSNGATLPVATLNVVSTVGFSPGTGGNPNAVAPNLTIQTGVSTFSQLTYTGTTATTFTGCSGGTGSLSSTTGVNGVWSPTVWFDPNGYFGQSANAFADGTLLVNGNQFVVRLDSGGKKSHRGLLTRIAGSSAGLGFGFFGVPAEFIGSGKLGAYRLPFWSRGTGNIKVAYSAGYEPGKIPFDLQYATAMLVAQMVRIMPTGTPLTNENLGAYSYGVLTQSNEVPEIGSIQRTLARYREVSW